MGTFQILTTALLFTALGRTEVTGQTLAVVAGGDAVAVRVPRTYRAEMASVAFTTLEAGEGDTDDDRRSGGHSQDLLAGTARSAGAGYSSTDLSLRTVSAVTLEGRR